MDFTRKKYEKLLRTLLRQGFYFQTFEEFITNPGEKVIVLRHDVDKRPGYSLRFAEIESGLGIKASYYFRAVPESLNELIIKQISGMGHEVGYHYEDFISVRQKIKVIRQKEERFTPHLLESLLASLAIESFKKNLIHLRTLAPVSTICMHGSPISRWDSRLLWKHYDYHDFEIIGEPYFDVDYSKVLYLTDTGRRWDGEKYNIRDKAVAGFGSTKGKPLGEIFVFSSTSGIIEAIESGKFPVQSIINTHPQRWTNNIISWITELLFQNIKNMVKYYIVRTVNKKQ